MWSKGQARLMKMRLTRSRLQTSSPGSEDIILLDGMKDEDIKRRRKKSGVSVKGQTEIETEVEYVGRVTRSRRKSRLSNESSASAEIIFVDEVSHCGQEVFGGNDSSPLSRTSGTKRRSHCNAGRNNCGNKGRNNNCNGKDVVRFSDLSKRSGVMDESCRETDDSFSGSDPADIVVVDQLVPSVDVCCHDETVPGSPKRRRVEAGSVQDQRASNEQLQLTCRQMLGKAVAELTNVVGKTSAAGPTVLNFEHIVSDVKGVESGSLDSNVKVLLRSVDSGLCGSQVGKRKIEADVPMNISDGVNSDSIIRSDENAQQVTQIPEENEKNSSNLSIVSAGIPISISTTLHASCALPGSDMMVDGLSPGSSEDVTAVNATNQSGGDCIAKCESETLCPLDTTSVVEFVTSPEVGSLDPENTEDNGCNSHELVPTQLNEQIASGHIDGTIETCVMTAHADFDIVLEDQENANAEDVVEEGPSIINDENSSEEETTEEHEIRSEVIPVDPSITKVNDGEVQLTLGTSVAIPVDPSVSEVNDGESELTLGASVEVSDEMEENADAPKMIIDEEWIQAMASERSRIEIKPVGLVRKTHADDLVVEPPSGSIYSDNHITNAESQNEDNSESTASSDVSIIVPVNTDLALQPASAAGRSLSPGFRISSDDDGTVTAVVVGNNISKNCRRIYDRSVHKEFSCTGCHKSYMLLHPFKVHLLKCCPHNLPTDLPLTRQELRTKQLMFSPENIAKAIGGVPTKSSSDSTKSRSCRKISDIVTVPAKRLKITEKSSPRKSPHYNSKASICSNTAASIPPSNVFGSTPVSPATNSDITAPVVSTLKQKAVDENSTTSSTESEPEVTNGRISAPNGDLSGSKSRSTCEADPNEKQIMSPPKVKASVTEREARIKLFSVYMGQRPKPGPVKFPSKFPDETPEENLAYVLFTVEMEPGGMFYQNRRQMAIKLLDAAKANKPSSNLTVRPLQYSSEMPPPPPPSSPASQWRFSVPDSFPRPFIRPVLSRTKPYYESKEFKPMLERSKMKTQLENSRLKSENETAEVGRYKPLFESGRHMRGSYAVAFH